MPDETKTYLAFTDGQLATLLMLLKRMGCYETLTDDEKDVLAIVERGAEEASE